MSTEVDRRKFLKYSGAAGAATGALWAAPSVLGSSNAFAAGSCDKKDEVNWGAMTNGTLATSTATHIDLTPNRVRGGSGPVSSYSVGMDVTPIGMADARSAAVDSGNAYGNVSGAYRLNMTGTAQGVAAGPYGWDITFSWPSHAQAYALSFSIVVIDQDAVTGGYADYASVDPYRFNVSASDYWISGDGNQGSLAGPWSGQPPGKDDFGNDVGGPADTSSNTSNVSLNDAFSTGLSSVTVSFRGDSTYYGTPQSLGISNLTWCL